ATHCLGWRVPPFTDFYDQKPTVSLHEFVRSLMRSSSGRAPCVHPPRWRPRQRLRSDRRCKKFGRCSEKSQSNSEAEGGPRTPELRRHEWGQRRCKKFGRCSEKSQSNSEAAGGPRTPESRRHEQGYCAPAGDDGGYGQSSCPADHAQAWRDEPYTGRCCFRERRIEARCSPGCGDIDARIPGLWLAGHRNARPMDDMSPIPRDNDGSALTLTLRDVIGRAVALELAYNPNDCVEPR